MSDQGFESWFAPGVPTDYAADEADQIEKLLCLSKEDRQRVTALARRYKISRREVLRRAVLFSLWNSMTDNAIAP